MYSAMIIPKLLYGVQVFSQYLNQDTFDAFIKKCAGFYFKHWAGVSQTFSTSNLLHSLFENDYLSVHHRNNSQRRILSEFYCHGLHRRLCTAQRCFVVGENCCCRLCGSAWFGNHLAVCTLMDGDGRFEDRLLALFM